MSWINQQPWQRWFNHVYVLVFIVSVVISLVVMLAHLNAPYWFDESLTIFYVRQPFQTMLKYIANDFFPPAYYFVLRLWMSWFGVGEAATATLSLLFAGLTAVLVYAFGRKFFDRQTALQACILFWVSGATVYFATETRMYTLLMAIAVACSALFFAVLAQPRRFAVHAGYGLVALLGVYTRYEFWFLIFAHGLLALAVSARRQRLQLHLPFAAVQLGLLVAYVPQWVVVWDKVTSWYLAPEVNWIDLTWKGVNIFWRLPQDMLFFEQLDPVRWLIILGWWLVLVLLLAPWIRATVNWRQRSVQFGLAAGDQRLMLLAGQLVIPLVVFYVLRVYVSRYVVFLTPIFCLLVVCGVRYLQPKLLQRTVFVGLIAIIASINLVNAVSIPKHYQSGRWPAVAEWLEQQPVEPDMVIVANFDDSIALDHYYDGLMPFRRLSPAPLRPGDDPVVAAIRWIGRRFITPADVPLFEVQLQGVPALWFIRGLGADLYDPDKLIETMLESRCATMSRRIKFPRDSAWSHPTLAVTAFRDCTFITSRF